MRTLLVVCLAAACSSTDNGSGGGGDPPLGGANTVTGNVVDFLNGNPISGAATVSAIGLPDAQVSDSGAAFTITDVPDNSLFQLLASASTYAPTYSPAMTTTVGDVSGVKAYAVPEAFVTATASGYSVTPSPSAGVLLVQLVDSTGAPKAGVAGSNLVLAGVTGASGPHFLDASLGPSTATSSSTSGWAVWYNVPAGSVALGVAVNATVTLQMAQSPITAASVTIATASVASGAPPPPPANVSFAAQVYPIFTSRGCVECHSGNKIGANLGDLSLDGGSNHVYGQIVTTAHPDRVVTSAPATSKLLAMPSYSNPSNGHPVVVFTGPQDKDYVTILQWITEGAKNN
jgi:hypothetical protein